ncbi:recombinase [Candidatus Pacearchaeota archaeon]|nr:recombinase [Candidatus Pacearchaeota archaeon]
MSVNELSEYIRVSKYAQYNEEKGRRETWDEQLDRVMGMHKEKYAYCLPDIQEELAFAEEFMRKKKVLGSQRALQFGGYPILSKEARIYNCSASYIDRIAFFQEAFWLALCGCGVGMSVQKHHIALLPRIKVRDKGEKIYVVDDSIEGWADALGVLLSSFFTTKDATFPEYQGYVVKMDFSNIRPEGAPIKSSGAKAPGPKGLIASLTTINNLLTSKLEGKSYYKLRPIDAYDIVCHTFDAVLSGGVRRSSAICLFSKDDEEMLNAKTGNWLAENPQRARANNSVVLLRNTTTAEEFDEIMLSVKEFGEPGFIWADDLELLLNPCAEVGLLAKHPVTGESGWQVCNLSEGNMAKVKTPEAFYDVCKAASIIGTLQAGYTDLAYLGQVSKEIIEGEALIGVSMTGIMDSPEIALNPAVLKKGAEIVKATNKALAKKLGINPAARSTLVKPSGTASAMLGTASGIHPHHANRYFRLVQANKHEETLRFFRKHNPFAIEQSVWDTNKLTDVITFCCEVPSGAKTKNQINAIDFLEKVKLVQTNWVMEGKDTDLCAAPWLSHNVSNTIHVMPHEWDDVTAYIFDNREYFTGISLIPQSGDKDYPQSPFTAVYTPNEIVKMYGDASIFASGLVVHGIKAFDENVWEACNAILGYGKPLEMPDTTDTSIGEIQKMAQSILDKEFWIKRAKKFADRYFDGDIKKMTYCLKDVYNWKRWVDLKRDYVKVPWTEFYEDDNNTKFEQSIACSGGSCEIL